MASQGARNVANGKAYERKIVNALNDKGGVFKFRRRIVTGHSASIIDVESVGDIISVNGTLRFVLEMKNQKGFSLEAMLTSGEKTLFFKWWSQCLRDMKLSKNSDLEPLVFFTSRTTNMVAMSDVGFSRLFTQPVTFLSTNSFPSYTGNVIMMTLNEFLSKCEVDALCVQPHNGAPCAANQPLEP